VGGEVEGNRQSLLPRGEVAAVEGVGFLSGGEAGVLADGPRPAGVHRRVRSAGEGREAGIAAVDADIVFRAVNGDELDAFDRLARQLLAARFLLASFFQSDFDGLSVTRGA
jgi:hypothetical protein